MEGGAVTSSPQHTPGGQKKGVKSENKSVRFEENTAIPSSIHRPMSAKKAAQAKGQQSPGESNNRSQSGAPMSQTQSLLELEKEIKVDQCEGNFSDRNKNLLRYCKMANESS